LETPSQGSINARFEYSYSWKWYAYKKEGRRMVTFGIVVTSWFE